MMGLTSVAVSFGGKVDSVCQHTEAVGNEELWDSTRKRKRGTNSTDSASTPLFWRVGEDEECRVGRFATAKHLK